jgi:hypothetical protein
MILPLFVHTFTPNVLEPSGLIWPLRTINYLACGQSSALQRGTKKS